MKTKALYISRLLVGSLLLVSGVIKANDAVGFSYKLFDYFTEGVLGMEFLQPYTVAMAITICVIEILLGISIIFGLKAKTTTAINLLMMLFFTFLTFYSAYFNKVTDCGCFGDALKLTPWESFWKDVVLLLLSIQLFVSRKVIKPLNSGQLQYVLPSLILITLFSVGVIGWWFPVFFAILVYGLMLLIQRFDTNQWRLLSLSGIASLLFIFYTYNHLPIEDFRPYKIGNNIIEGMQVPKDALPELTEYYWEFTVNGEDKIVTNNGTFPSDAGGVLKGVTTKIIREAVAPKIHDFTIEDDVSDETNYVLTQDNVLVIVAYDFSKSSDEGFQRIKKLTDQAIEKGYTVVGLTAESLESRSEKIAAYKLGFKFYFCDGTTLKTMVRANPGIIEMDNATINQKLHWNDYKNLML